MKTNEKADPALVLAATILAAMLLLAATTGVPRAYGGERDGTMTYYDARGNRTGSSTTIGNTTNFYDARGNRVESSTTTGNQTKYYSPTGSLVGTTTGRKR